MICCATYPPRCWSGSQTINMASCSCRGATWYVSEQDWQDPRLLSEQFLLTSCPSYLQAERTRRENYPSRARNQQSDHETYSAKRIGKASLPGTLTNESVGEDLQET